MLTSNLHTNTYTGEYFLTCIQTGLAKDTHTARHSASQEVSEKRDVNRHSQACAGDMHTQQHKLKNYKKLNRQSGISLG